MTSILEDFYKSQDVLVPTMTTIDYWIKMEVDRNDYDPKDVGKWLLFLPPSEIDAAWIKIKDLLKDHKLGDAAKVSTAKRGGMVEDVTKYVICVFTNDSNDVEDIARIAFNIFSIVPNVDRMQYKSDRVTHLGVYTYNYKGVVCKYDVDRSFFVGKDIRQFADSFNEKGVTAGYNEAEMVTWHKTLLTRGYYSFDIHRLRLNSDGSYTLRRG